MGDKKKFKDLAGDRTSLVSSLLDRMESQIEKGQRDLLRSVINDFLDKMETDDAGQIKNSLANKRRLQLFDGIYSRFVKSDGLAVVQGIAEGAARIVDFNQKYFTPFAEKTKIADVSSNVSETLGAWLGIEPRGNITPNGYLDTLVKNDSVKNNIRNMVLRSVISQAGYTETKKALQVHIEGTPETTGALKKYYRNFAFDTFSIADRTAGKIFADKLQLNYAIYEGGLIETSRDFCEEKNGKVFSRDEIAKFDITEARPPGYNPFTDLGGYGCRHHLNWIPDSVAFALRPDLKNTVPAADVKAAEAEPIPVIVEKPKFTPPKTVQEAETRLKALGIKEVNLKGMEKEQASAVLEGLEMESNYGPVKLDSLTTYTNENISINASYMPEKNAITLNLSNIGKTFNQVPESYPNQLIKAETQLNELKEFLGSKTVNQEDVKSSIEAINERIFVIKDRIKKGETAKVWSNSSAQKTKEEAIKTTLIHELGHYRHFKELGIDIDFEYNPANSATEYGRKNHKEFFAEWYTFFRLNGEKGVPKDLLKIFKTIKNAK